MPFNNLFYVKKYERYTVYKILFLKLTLKDKYSFKEIFHAFHDVIYKMIPNTPPSLEKMKLFVLGLTDNYFKWQYNIRYKKYSYDEIIKLFEVYNYFPKNIMSVEETIDYIINNKCSVSRIGDGEELLDNMLGQKCKFPELKDKLINIYKQGSNKNCLVCLNNFPVKNNNIPVFYRNHFINYWLNVSDKGLMDLEYNHSDLYGDAYAFLFYFKENDSKEITEEKKQRIKQIWENKKILFVINRDSPVLQDNKMFNNALQKDFIYIPSTDAYSEYERITSEIHEKYDNTWILYLECGPLATVLAYELAQEGYQALDMGSFYERICNKKP